MRCAMGIASVAALKQSSFRRHVAVDYAMCHAFIFVLRKDVFEMCLVAFGYACAMGIAFVLAHELVFARLVSMFLSMRCAMGIVFWRANTHSQATFRSQLVCDVPWGLPSYSYLNMYA